MVVGSVDDVGDGVTEGGVVTIDDDVGELVYDPPPSTSPFVPMAVGDAVVPVSDTTDGESVGGVGGTTGGVNDGDIDGAAVGFSFLYFLALYDDTMTSQPRGWRKMGYDRVGSRWRGKGEEYN